MNLKELNFEQQVNHLRQLIKSQGSSLAGYLALSVFRQHLIEKHRPENALKPVLRWYLGQLAKIYIRKYFNEAKANLNNFADIGLVEVSADHALTKNQNVTCKEYHLSEALFPALRYALEETFGSEYISEVASSIKFYKPRSSVKDIHLNKKSEVRECQQ